jgi:2-polyprenyl-6-methoxyphenol hydroxylase-like FAD-dependent oxidoreductase
MPDNPVLIVDAGPTGLVFAIELARRGVPFHLIDRHPQPLTWDRATVMKSRSLEVFAALGLADAFVQRGRILRGVNLFAGDAQVASFRFHGLDSPFPFILDIPEHQTELILTQRLEQLGGRVQRGVEFVGLDQRELGVQARLRSLHDGERTLEAGWVVGTDGIHSGVRVAIGDEFEGHDNPTPWGVVDAHLSGWHPSDLAVVQLEPPTLSTWPLADGRWRVYFLPDPEEEDVLATVSARLAATSPGAALQDPDQPQLFHTHARVARRYRIGRVLLAGDAAHACSPIEGHGMNTGIQDAYNLGWKLALVISGAAPATLLDSYEAERRPIAQAIANSGEHAEARVAEQASAERQALIAFLATPEGRRDRRGGDHLRLRAEPHRRRGARYAASRGRHADRLSGRRRCTACRAGPYVLPARADRSAGPYPPPPARRRRSGRGWRRARAGTRGRAAISAAYAGLRRYPARPEP